MYNGIGLRTVRGTATSGHVQANRSYVRPSSERWTTGKNVRGPGGNSNTKNDRIPKRSNHDKGNTKLLEHQKKRKIANAVLEYRLSLERNTSNNYAPEEIERLVKIRHDRLQSDFNRQQAAEKERRKAERKAAIEMAKPKAEEEEEVGLIQEGTTQGSSTAIVPHKVGGDVDGKSDRHYRNQYRRDNGRGRWDNRNGVEKRRRERNEAKVTTDTHRRAELKDEENRRMRDAFGIVEGKFVSGMSFDQELQKKKRDARKAEYEKRRKSEEMEESRKKREIMKENKSSSKRRRRERSKSVSSSEVSVSSSSSSSGSSSRSSSRSSSSSRSRSSSRSGSVSSKTTISSLSTRDRHRRRRSRSVSSTSRSYRRRRRYRSSSSGSSISSSSSSSYSSKSDSRGRYRRGRSRSSSYSSRGSSISSRSSNSIDRKEKRSKVTRRRGRSYSKSSSPSRKNS